MGRITQGTDRVPRTVSIDKEIWEKIEYVAKIENRLLSGQLTLILNKWIDQNWKLYKPNE